MPRRVLLWPLIPLVILALVGWLIVNTFGDKDTAKEQPSSQTAKEFNKSARSLSDSNSIWVIVNKKRPLQPTSYEPSDRVTPNVPLRLKNGGTEMTLRQAAAEALEQMVNDAKKDGIQLMLASGYRSFGYQDNLYKGYVARQGQTAADTQSARAGYSEHQTGLAADVEPLDRNCEIEECFADTAEGKWVAARAHHYGFIIRYPKDKQHITGYIYEPWHLRYVGTELASEIAKTPGQTLESFFGLENASSY